MQAKHLEQLVTYMQTVARQLRSHLHRLKEVEEPDLPSRMALLSFALDLGDKVRVQLVHAFAWCWTLQLDLFPRLLFGTC